jgi:UDP:flavonoid glycosyltransferase YjiC (YdhE family)
VAGSRGDVQPAAVLAAALQERGHAVRLATHEHFRPLAASLGLWDFQPLGGEPKARCFALLAIRRAASFAVLPVRPLSAAAAAAAASPFHTRARARRPGRS